MSRKIIGAIAQAELLPPSANPFPARRRMTAAQKEGRRFERGIAKAMAKGLGEKMIYSARWIRYSDDGGLNLLAQPDVFALPLVDKSILLLEAKLTLSAAAVEEGLTQLRELYAPLLSFIWPGMFMRLALVGKYLADRQKPEARVYSIDALGLGELDSTARIIHLSEPGRLVSWAKGAFL